MYLTHGRPKPPSSSALLLQNITKHFGIFTALEGVTASFMPGRIHGVLGENGAGKSTLMRIAAGLLAPDHGRIRIGNIGHARWNATQATAAGIAMVHQHFMLVPTLTVAENCAWAVAPWGSGRRGGGRRGSLKKSASGPACASIPACASNR